MLRRAGDGTGGQDRLSLPLSLEKEEGLDVLARTYIALSHCVWCQGMIVTIPKRTYSDSILCNPYARLGYMFVSPTEIAFPTVLFLALLCREVEIGGGEVGEVS